MHPSRLFSNLASFFPRDTGFFARVVRNNEPRNTKGIRIRRTWGLELPEDLLSFLKGTLTNLSKSSFCSFLFKHIFRPVFLLDVSHHFSSCSSKRSYLNYHMLGPALQRPLPPTSTPLLGRRVRRPPRRSHRGAAGSIGTFELAHLLK